MATIQTFAYSFTTELAAVTFQSVDIGGSMNIHTFGAYFGLTVSYIIGSKEQHGHKECSSNYISNVFGMIGTLFLWMYWPSFNGALSNGNAQHRVVINTILSLCGSCFMVFMINLIFKKGKLHMEDVLNATLAGGVIIGASADLVVSAWIALLIGCIGGTISVLGYEVLTPWLAKTIGLHDTCGIHNLHAMPGFIGGIISAICAGSATSAVYGDSLLILFPALVTRSKSQQAGYQLAALGCMMGNALIVGGITGWILKSPCWDIKLRKIFDDRELWHFEDDTQESLVKLPSSNSDNDKVNDEYRNSDPNDERKLRKLSEEINYNDDEKGKGKEVKIEMNAKV